MTLGKVKPGMTLGKVRPGMTTKKVLETIDFKDLPGCPVGFEPTTFRTTI